MLKWISNSAMDIDRKRQRMHDDTSTTEANMAEMNDTGDSPEEAYFRKTVFYVLIDDALTGLSVRFNAVMKLAEIFIFNIPHCVKVSWKRKQQG